LFNVTIDAWKDEPGQRKTSQQKCGPFQAQPAQVLYEAGERQQLKYSEISWNRGTKPVFPSQ